MSHITRSVTPPPEPQLHDEYTTFHKKQKRHGHDQDVTDDNDIRQVAGCLPLDMKTGRVLLISSSKNKGSWVLPKGGWEQDETKKHAAQRETWEEAGVKGTITRDLGVFEERTAKKKNLKAHHWIFEMEIDDVKKKFPEKKKRERKWFTFEEAILATQDHRYIQEAILKSSLNPNKGLPVVEPAVIPTATKKSVSKLKPIVNPAATNSPKLQKATLANNDPLGSPPSTPRESVESTGAAADKETSTPPVVNKEKPTEDPVVVTNLETVKEPSVNNASLSLNQVQPINDSTDAAAPPTSKFHENQSQQVDATTKDLSSMSLATDEAAKPSPKPKKSIVKSIKSIFQ